MTAIVASPAASATGLLEDYVAHQHLLGGAPSWQRDRIAAARAFLRDYPDLDVWMARPLDARLVDLQRRRSGTWPFVGFAILTGACRADPELLFAKSFGPTMSSSWPRRPHGSVFPTRPPLRCCARPCRW